MTLKRDKPGRDERKNVHVRCTGTTFRRHRGTGTSSLHTNTRFTNTELHLPKNHLQKEFLLKQLSPSPSHRPTKEKKDEFTNAK